MRRNLLSGIVAAALLPAALLSNTLWAAPDVAPPSTQYLNQIGEQAFQIQVQADRLESYLRSGAHDAVSASGYAFEMAESAQKLATLLDAFVSQPGTTNVTRQQVERMKVALAEIDAFVGSASQDLDTHAMALHLNGILANISNIMDRGNMLRSAAQILTVTN